VTTPLTIVVAYANNRVIGRDNRLLWRLKTDLRRFRDLTLGKPMIMGRKTFDSIGRSLPGRETIVLTRDERFSADGVHVVHSWDEALAKGQERALAMSASEVPVVGGAEIYALALPQVHKLYVTEVDTAHDGDAFFPAVDRSSFRELARSSHPKGAEDEHSFTFIDLERRS
jgi:dihydrofolate reductase